MYSLTYLLSQSVQSATNMFNSYVCGEPFTKQFSLKRHMKRKHAKINFESEKENPKISNFTETGRKIWLHFTMIVAASTGGGKMWFGQNLLHTENS